MRAHDVSCSQGYPHKRGTTPRAIHRIITEGLLLADVKKPGIVVHSLRLSTPIFALFNDANPTRVQKMMRHQHYAITESYVEEVRRLLEAVAPTESFQLTQGYRV